MESMQYYPQCYEDDFLRIFGYPLERFYGGSLFETGFKVLEFASSFRLENDNQTIFQAINEKYGQEGEELIRIIMAYGKAYANFGPENGNKQVEDTGTGKKGQYQIVMNPRGSKHLETVEGAIYWPYGLRKAPYFEMSKPTWGIDHLPTGLRITPVRIYDYTKKEMVAIIKELLALPGDWYQEDGAGQKFMKIVKRVKGIQED